MLWGWNTLELVTVFISPPSEGLDWGSEGFFLLASYSGSLLGGSPFEAREGVSYLRASFASQNQVPPYPFSASKVISRFCKSRRMDFMRTPGSQG